MNILFEFFDKEPIDNIITALNYRVDKVVYYGYEEVMDKRKMSIDAFLKENCGVLETLYRPISHTTVSGTVEQLTKDINAELAIGNNVFFDATGGEDMALLSFGIVTAQLDVPIHKYDILKNEIITVKASQRQEAIKKLAPQQNVRLTIDELIRLQGGVVNYSMHKDQKNVEGDSLMEMEALWDIAGRNSKKWNTFSEFLRGKAQRDGLSYTIRDRYSDEYILSHQNRILLEELAKAGLVKDLQISKDEVTFTLKNDYVASAILESGSILEEKVFQIEKARPDCTDCKIGVHIDWDGVIHTGYGKDVLNEIDVLSLRGNIPVFISCKTGSVNQNALYELETVADRFGGAYVKKILAVSRSISSGYKHRAEDMGIEVLLVQGIE